MVQAGSNDEKTGGRKSCGTVISKKFDLFVFLECRTSFEELQFEVEPQGRSPLEIFKRKLIQYTLPNEGRKSRDKDTRRKSRAFNLIQLSKSSFKYYCNSADM